MFFWPRGGGVPPRVIMDIAGQSSLSCRHPFRGRDLKTRFDLFFDWFQNLCNRLGTFCHTFFLVGDHREILGGVPPQIGSGTRSGAPRDPIPGFSQKMGIFLGIFWPLFWPVSTPVWGSISGPGRGQKKVKKMVIFHFLGVSPCGFGRRIWGSGRGGN